MASISRQRAHAAAQAPHQVGLLDPGSPAPRRACPRDHAAEVEHHDAVGEAHHEVHVVLDDQHRARWPRCPHDARRGRRCRLSRVHRPVRRAGGAAAASRERGRGRPACARGRAATPRARPTSAARPRAAAGCGGSHPCLVRRRRRRVRAGRARSRAPSSSRRGRGPAACARPLGRSKGSSGPTAPSACHRSRCPRPATHESADRVEDRGLSGAVGPDEGEVCDLRDLEGDIVEGSEPAEGDGEPADPQPGRW